MNNINGFTYIAVLTVVVIMGIMLGMVGQSWKTINQREKEVELRFRGEQVAEVVYQKLLCKNANMNQQTVNQFLWNVKTASGTILDDLVKTGIQENCLSGGQRIFRLRPSAALDPFTGEQWDIVTPATPITSLAGGLQSTISSVKLKSISSTATSGDTIHFSGVRSSSILKPFKQKFNSLDEFPLLDAAMHYNEWLFTWEQRQKMETVTTTPLIKK